MAKDEFEGMGGSYIVDKNGKKTLAHRTAEAVAVSPAAKKEKGKKQPAPEEVKNVKANP